MIEESLYLHRWCSACRVFGARPAPAREIDGALLATSEAGLSAGTRYVALAAAWTVVANLSLLWLLPLVAAIVDATTAPVWNQIWDLANVVGLDPHGAGSAATVLTWVYLIALALAISLLLALPALLLLRHAARAVLPATGLALAVGAKSFPSELERELATLPKTERFLRKASALRC